jgi:hypothetical protein
MRTLLDKLQYIDAVFLSIAQLFASSTQKEKIMTKIYAMILSSIRKIWPYIDYQKQTTIYHIIKEYENNMIVYEQSKQYRASLNQEVVFNHEIILSTTLIQIISGI